MYFRVSGFTFYADLSSINSGHHLFIIPPDVLPGLRFHLYYRLHLQWPLSDLSYWIHLHWIFIFSGFTFYTQRIYLLRQYGFIFFGFIFNTSLIFNGVIYKYGFISNTSSWIHLQWLYLTWLLTTIIRSIKHHLLFFVIKSGVVIDPIIIMDESEKSSMCWILGGSTTTSPLVTMTRRLNNDYDIAPAVLGGWVFLHQHWVKFFIEWYNLSLCPSTRTCP